MKLLKSNLYVCFYVLITAISPAINAHDDIPNGITMAVDQDGLKPVKPDSHAPIGVMADHTHKTGEWMLSYRFRYMSMEDNYIGDDEVSPQFIVDNIPNRFGMPPTLRVVPTSMTMDMHMFGGMYAPTDWLTLMVMGMYMIKEMDHITYMGMGMAPFAPIGTFTTRSEGFGDTRVTGMFEVFHAGAHRVQLNAGLSLPTGSITERDRVLAPNGLTPVLRLPYPMQLGSGTFDLLPGIVYAGNHDKWGWGAQYAGEIRLGTNDENYTLGDKHLFTGWASYRWLNWLSTSFRVEAEHTGKIDGIDPIIAAPVQTADPDNQGGEKVSVLFGFNVAGQSGELRGHRLALEAGFPVYQDLNGPQLGTDFTVTAGWQYAF